MRTLIATLAVLAAASPLGAQHGHHGQPAQQTPGQAAPDHSKYPAGWQVRVDRDAARGQVWMMDHGSGELHFSTGPAGAVYYNPEWSRSGDYTFSARFRQAKASPHPEGYGLVIGGKELDGAGQGYSYFLVRQTGEYFIATRRGAERAKVVDWTPSPAIRKVEGDAGAENVLGVQVKGDEVVFSVNGTEVARRPRSEVATDGVAGFRVNHRLELLVDRVEK